MDSGFCHIKLGIVQQSKGYTALGRLSYQTNGYFNDGKRHADYGKYRGDHDGGLILLPHGASAEFADMANFFMAAAFREVRVDAQGGRTIDFALPREVPRELLRPVAAFVLAEFAAQGMAVQLDIEYPVASDEDYNPHCHAWLAQRILESDGFGKKRPEWDRQFLRDKARYARALIAGRLTLACALLGVAAYVDPRRNEQRGLPQPEDRIPAKFWRMYDRGVYVPGIEKLKDARQANKAAKVVRRRDAETSENLHSVSVRNAVSRRHPPSDEVRQAYINTVIPLAEENGVEVRGSNGSKPEIVLTTRAGSVVFDGEILSFEGVAGTARAQLIVKLARTLDWPAVIVEGDAQSTDEIIVAGVVLGVTAINTCASEYALRLIKKNYGRLLSDTVRPLDPISVVDELLATYTQFAEVEPADASSVLPGGSEPAFDSERRETVEPSVTEVEHGSQDFDDPWQDAPDEVADAVFEEEEEEEEPESEPNFDDDEMLEPGPHDT
ncbi:MobA/MobL family protein [Bradyrhizobium sp. SSUT18]|uniref:MobA/MobL family protein n=1 Tax=Bradyrhizobium sp. SSUT18 TaxID=3040602 RepID=UPI0024471024|nr:MobA/MobL family protein [Bradyrhizobium sp. SSUT18]MDH2399827.1 MobA/MobL family protein [Bradyrhizobium sp. SSUT18]